MELGHPLAVVTPTLDGDVLTLLAQQDASFTTGQLHRLLPSYSEEGIRKVLRRLSRQGIVDAERVGNAYSYRLNRDHLAAGPLIELAQLPRRLLQLLEERLASWSHRPRYAAIFGSAARGTMTPDSDLDLFLVRDDGTPADAWEAQVTELVADVSRWTGNDTRPLEYALSELSDADSDPVLHDVLRDGLTVAGSRAWFSRQLRGEAD